MPKYAQFDPQVPLPAPIIGWYDTDIFDYPSLSSDALYAMDEQQWSDHMEDAGAHFAYNGTTLVPYAYPTPPPTPDQVLAGKVADGLAITSTSTPALACTMALDATTMDQIGSVARDASSGLGLPADLPTFTYPDIDSTPRTFSEAQVIALYKAQRNMLYTLNTQAAIMRQGGEPSWPEQTAVIP